MEYGALFLGHGVRAQPLAGAEIVAQLILTERLSVVLEHRPWTRECRLKRSTPYHCYYSRKVGS